MKASTALVLVAIAGAACRDGGGRIVVAYVSEDQVFAEPILKDFEKETGIRVRTVFDTEEAKSGGGRDHRRSVAPQARLDLDRPGVIPRRG